MAIGSDIMMVLDECVELPAKRDYLEKSIEVTTRWAERCLKYYQRKSKKLAKKDKALLFGIVQGGLEKDLRLKSAGDLANLDFDGYAVGGLSVGESEDEMYSVLDYVTDAMPAMKPRYLMGVGYPHQIVSAVKRGVDMFDCVIPAREARHGRLYRFRKVKSVLVSKNFYETLNLKGEKNKFSKLPISPDSAFPELRKHTLSYLRHLFMSGDPTAQRLTTLNNLEFYLTLMKRLREELKNKQ